MAIAKDKRDYVNTVMNEIVYGMRSIFGNKLRQVILFGSYAVESKKNIQIWI